MEQTRIEEMVQRLLEGLPASLQAAKGDIEAHFGRALRSGIQKLDLVTREEFDAQSRVLARSRAMLEALEARVAALEGKPGNDKPGTHTR
jgi:ubiquinone biosynthesis accessory factor UbiK